MAIAPKVAKAGPGPLEVHIVTTKIDAEIQRAFVVPGRINTGTGETKVPSINWENRTNDKVQIWFPFGDHVFNQNDVKINGKQKQVGLFVTTTIEIPSKGTLTLTVKDSPTDGVYHYHVYSAEVNNSAEGDSEPTVSVP
jgi:hypothetical protein